MFERLFVMLRAEKLRSRLATVLQQLHLHLRNAAPEM